MQLVVADNKGLVGKKEKAPGWMPETLALKPIPPPTTRFPGEQSSHPDLGSAPSWQTFHVAASRTIGEVAMVVGKKGNLLPHFFVKKDLAPFPYLASGGVGVH